MMENTLVYHGAHAPIEELLDHAIKNPVRLDARDVEVVEAARAVEGEVWSPQLPAYRAWAAEGEAGDVAGGAGREGDLYSAGALWMGEFDELLAQAAERDAADAQETPRARMEEGLRGAVGVRQVPGGYALTAFDLRRFAAAVGQSDDLAVLLPAYVDGIPVVRVAVEAFARRFVQGVGVLLLVVPDTVEHIAANAFAAMSAQRIHIGRGVSQLGEQRCDLAGVSPRLARREYSVDAGNARYLAREGNLFSDGGRELVFLASPYGERVSLPDGVERVASSAFADGCEPPAVVDCSAALARVDSRSWDDAVWRCPVEAPAYRALRKRGVRLAGPAAVELEGCWYDFDAEGAVLVAGPPKPISVSRRRAGCGARRGRARQRRGCRRCRRLRAFARCGGCRGGHGVRGLGGSGLHRGLRVGQRERRAGASATGGRAAARAHRRKSPAVRAGLGGGTRNRAHHRTRQRMPRHEAPDPSRRAGFHRRALLLVA